jgi:hypothetical protein
VISVADDRVNNISVANCASFSSARLLHANEVGEEDIFTRFCLELLCIWKFGVADEHVWTVVLET